MVLASFGLGFSVNQIYHIKNPIEIINIEIHTINNTVTSPKCEMYNAYKESYYNKSVANGIYWIGKDYYCVWINNRTIEEQEKTDRHEYCHYLIDNNYKHFCEV